MWQFFSNSIINWDKKYLISLIFALFFFAQSTYADLGPKPEVNIMVTYDGEQIQDKEFYSVMLSCSNQNIDPNNKIKYCDFDNESICEELAVITIQDTERNCIWSFEELAWGGNCRNSKCNFKSNRQSFDLMPKS